MTKQEVILLLRNSNRFKARNIYLRYMAKKLNFLLKQENDKVDFLDYLHFPKGILIRDEEGNVEQPEQVAQAIVDGEAPKRIKAIKKELNMVKYEMSQIQKAQKLIKAFQEGLSPEQCYIVSMYYIKGNRQKEVHEWYNDKFGEVSFNVFRKSCCATIKEIYETCAAKSMVGEKRLQGE